MATQMKTNLNSKNLSRAIPKLVIAHLVIVIAIWVFVTPPLSKEEFNLNQLDFRKYFHKLFHILVGLGIGSLGQGKHNWSSMLFCLILSCFCAELYILSKFMLEWLTSGIRLTQGLWTFNFQSIIQGLGLANMLIVCFYPSVGKISILATGRFMSVIAFMFLLLQTILKILQVYDPLSLMTINFFGGVCGVAVATYLKKSIQVDIVNDNLIQTEIKEVISLIGSIFICVYSPFIVGDFTLDVDPLYHKHQAAVNSILAISAGTFTCYYTTYFCFKKPRSSDVFIGALASFICASALAGMRMNHSLVMTLAASTGAVSAIVNNLEGLQFSKGTDQSLMIVKISDNKSMITKSNANMRKQDLNKKAKESNCIFSKIDVYDPSLLISSVVIPSVFSLIAQSICLIIIDANPQKYASLILNLPKTKQFVNNIIGLVVASLMSLITVRLIKYSVDDYTRNQKDFYDQDHITTLIAKKQKSEVDQNRSQFQRSSINESFII